MHARPPASLIDLLAVRGGDEAAEGQAPGRVLLREARDGRAAGAVQGGQERPLAQHRQPRVLVVQRRQDVQGGAVALSAGYADRALRGMALSPIQNLPAAAARQHEGVSSMPAKQYAATLNKSQGRCC